MIDQKRADHSIAISLSRCSSVSSDLAKSYWSLLSEEERLRNRRYRFEKDRHRDLIARALVRTSLAETLAEEPSAIKIRNDEKGKPQLLNNNDVAACCDQSLYFNLTHSGDWILLAIANTRVGIDVEYTQRNNDVLAIVNRYFFGDEITELFAFPQEQQLDRFYHYWTLKEAYIKARGDGLSLGLSNFGFCLKEGIRLHVKPELNDNPDNWWFQCFSPEPAYQVALALENNAVLNNPSDKSTVASCTYEEVIPLYQRRALLWNR